MCCIRLVAPGRREGLFLEVSTRQCIQFVRRTRTNNNAWGSHGFWTYTRKEIRLGWSCLSSDAAKDQLYALSRSPLTPCRPLHMHVGAGRTIRHLETLQMAIFGGPQRALALKPYTLKSQTLSWYARSHQIFHL